MSEINAKVRKDDDARAKEIKDNCTHPAWDAKTKVCVNCGETLSQTITE